MSMPELIEIAEKCSGGVNVFLKLSLQSNLKKYTTSVHIWKTCHTYRAMAMTQYHMPCVGLKSSQQCIEGGGGGGGAECTGG